MSRFLIAMSVGATIAAAASTSASAWHCLARCQRSGGHRLRRHTGKSPVNLNAPVHTPRRWGWLPNRMVPAVLEARDFLQDQIAKALSPVEGSATLGARCSAN